jgi:hypothetical protein
MKKFYLLVVLMYVACFMQSCATYYVAANNTPIELFTNEDMTDPAFDIPAGTALLMKGSPKNGWAKVRYHKDLTWYLVAAQHIYLVPGAMAKEYPTSFIAMESRIATLSSTPSTLQGSSEGYGNTILTGPRGGRYYINKNGNKSYVKKGTSSGGSRRSSGGGRRH